MGTTLIVNPGSTSKKYSLYRGGQPVFTASFEKVTDGYEVCVEHSGTEEQCEAVQQATYKTALKKFIALAQAEGVITVRGDIIRVGMRVVAPGTYFQVHRRINDDYIAALQDRAPLAPLHTPATLRQIAAVKEELPSIPIIGVSDSAFHADKPPVASEYSIPKADTEAYDIYRTGYHGLSVASVTRTLSRYVTDIPSRLVVVHVGGGVSVTALRDGVSIENTMGYSPESGLIMGSRAGDLDVGALLALMHQKRLQPFDAHVMVSTNGGLKGMLGNSDLRFALQQKAHANLDAIHALDAFAYQLKQAIGASVAVLNGIDTLVLTGTAAFRNPDIRALLLAELEWFGISVSTNRNDALVGENGEIQTVESKVQIRVLDTDEMGEIARVTQRVTE